jgi:DNA-binding MarR family transcriptional regulator
MIRILRRLRLEDDATGVSAARLSALSVIAFGGPLSLSALAAAEQVSLPSASRLVRELERAGLVRASADADDARALRLAVTARGRKLMLAGRERRLAVLRTGLAQLPAASRSALAAAAGSLALLAQGLWTDAPKVRRPPGRDRLR